MKTEQGWRVSIESRIVKREVGRYQIAYCVEVYDESGDALSNWTAGYVAVVAPILIVCRITLSHVGETSREH